MAPWGLWPTTLRRPVLELGEFKNGPKFNPKRLGMGDRKKDTGGLKFKWNCPLSHLRRIRDSRHEKTLWVWRLCRPLGLAPPRWHGMHARQERPWGYTVFDNPEILNFYRRKNSNRSNFKNFRIQQVKWKNRK